MTVLLAGSRLFARLYDLVMATADHVGLSVHRRRLGASVRGRGRVLEIGAGTGLQFRHYGPGTQVVATEPDVAMLHRARRRRAAARASVTLVAADAAALPFRDVTFAAVVAALAFCTIPDPGRAAAEMRRVLRPSGRAHLLEHVRARHAPLAWTQVALTPAWRRVAGGCRLARRTVETLREAGFDVRVRRAQLDGMLVELSASPVRRLPAAEARNEETPDEAMPRRGSR